MPRTITESRLRRIQEKIAQAAHASERTPDSRTRRDYVWQDGACDGVEMTREEFDSYIDRIAAENRAAEPERPAWLQGAHDRQPHIETFGATVVVRGDAPGELVEIARIVSVPLRGGVV